VEKTLKVIKELKEKKVLKDFSIGGGIANSQEVWTL
jgi:hypothetical protein